ALPPQPPPPTPSDWVAGPRPQPWSPGDWVSLNPQPLPPFPVMGLMSARVGSVTDDFLWYAPGDGGTGSLGAGGGSHRLNPAFELSQFSFGAENPTTIGSATGGAGGGKAEFAEFNISKLAHAHFFKNC